MSRNAGPEDARLAGRRSKVKPWAAAHTPGQGSTHKRWSDKLLFVFGCANKPC